MENEEQMKPTEVTPTGGELTDGHEDMDTEDSQDTIVDTSIDNSSQQQLGESPGVDPGTSTSRSGEENPASPGVSTEGSAPKSPPDEPGKPQVEAMDESHLELEEGAANKDGDVVEAEVKLAQKDEKIGENLKSEVKTVESHDKIEEGLKPEFETAMQEERVVEKDVTELNPFSPEDDSVEKDVQTEATLEEKWQAMMNNTKPSVCSDETKSVSDCVLLPRKWEPVYGDDPRIDAMQVSDFAKQLKMECLQRLPRIILEQVDLDNLESIDLTKVDIATCLKAATTATVCFNRQPYPKSTASKRRESSSGRRGRKAGRKRGRPRQNNLKVTVPVIEVVEEPTPAPVVVNEELPREEPPGSSTTSPEPKKFPCLECDKSFARKVSLNHHVYTKHGTHNMIQCVHCHKWLLDECSLASHTKYVHAPANKSKGSELDKADDAPRYYDDEFRSDPDVCLPFSPSSTDPLMCSKCGRPVTMDTDGYGVAKEALSCHCKLFPGQFSDLKNVLDNGPLPLNSPLHDSDLHLSSVEPPTKGSTGSKSLSLSHFSEDNSDSEKGSLIELTNLKNFPLPSPTLRSSTNALSREFHDHSNDYMDIMRQTSYSSSTGDYWDTMDMKTGPAQTSNLFTSLEPVRVPSHDPFGPPQPSTNPVPAQKAQKERSSKRCKSQSQDVKPVDSGSTELKFKESKNSGPLDEDIPVVDPAPVKKETSPPVDEVPVSGPTEPTPPAEESAEVADVQQIEVPAQSVSKKSKKSKSKRKKKDKKKSKKEKIAMVEPMVVLEKCTLKFTGIHGIQETVTVTTKKSQDDDVEMPPEDDIKDLKAKLKDASKTCVEVRKADAHELEELKDCQKDSCTAESLDAKSSDTKPADTGKCDLEEVKKLEVDEAVESDKNEEAKSPQEAKVEESQTVTEAEQDVLKAAEIESKKQEDLEAEAKKKKEEEEAVKAAEEAKRQEAIKAAEAEAKRLAELREAKIREAKLAAEMEERKRRERERAKHLEEEHARLLREAEAKMAEAAKIKEKLAQEEEDRKLEEEQIRDLEAQTGIKIQLIRSESHMSAAVNDSLVPSLPAQQPQGSLTKQPIAVVMPTVPVAPSQSPMGYPSQQSSPYNSSVFPPSSPYLQQPTAPTTLPQNPLLSPQPQTSTNLMSPTHCTMLTPSPLMSPSQSPMFSPTGTPHPTGTPQNPQSQLSSPQTPSMLQMPPQPQMLQSPTDPSLVNRSPGLSAMTSSQLPQDLTQGMSPPVALPQPLAKPPQQQPHQPQQNMVMMQPNIYQQQSSIPEGYQTVLAEPNSGRSSPENFGSDLDDLIIFHNDFNLPKKMGTPEDVDAGKPKKKKKKKKKKKDQDEEAPEPVPEPVDESLLCQVCGAVAKVGDYYGGRICSSCKIFFSSTVKSGHDASYVCKSSENEICVIRPNNRKNCLYCRFQKCVKLGLLRDAVTEETAALEERANKRKHKSTAVTKPSPDPGDEETTEGAEKPPPAKKKKPPPKKKPQEADEESTDASPQPTPPIATQDPIYPMYQTLPPAAPVPMATQPGTVAYPGQVYPQPGGAMAPPPPPGAQYVSYGSGYIPMTQMMPQPTYLDSNGIPIKTPQAPQAQMPVNMPMYMQNQAGQMVQMASGVNQMVSTSAVPHGTALQQVPTQVMTSQVPQVMSSQVPTQVMNPQVPTQVMTSQVPTQVMTSQVPTQVMTSQVPTQAMTSQVPTQVMSSQVPTQVMSSQVPTQVMNPQVPTQVMTSQVPTQVMTSQVPTQVMTSQVPTQVMSSQVPTQVMTSQVRTRVVSSQVPTQVGNSQIPTQVTTSQVTTQVTTSQNPTQVMTSQDSTQVMTSQAPQVNTSEVPTSTTVSAP